MQAVQRVLQLRLQVPSAQQQASQMQQSRVVVLSVGDARCSSCCMVGGSFGSGSRLTTERREAESCSTAVRGCGGGARRLNVVCMARERRIKMVSQQIKREISALLLYDKVLQAAILPESALGADMYLTAVASISDVEMSKDLSVAKVYISIYGDERGQDIALEGLKNKAGYVRKQLAQSMNLKFTPEVRFIKDEALERGSRVMSILDKLKKDREKKEGKVTSNPDEDEGDENWQDVYDSEEQVQAEKDIGEEVVIGSKSRLSDDDEGYDADWVEEDENITFIK